MENAITLLKAWDKMLTPSEKRLIVFLNERNNYFDGNYTDLSIALDDMRKNGRITGNTRINVKKLEKRGFIIINYYIVKVNKTPLSFKLAENWINILLEEYLKKENK